MPLIPRELTSNYERQADSYLNSERYQEAVTLYERAIGQNATAKLLDKRAHCYTKLQQYSLALQDAKQAIKLAREDATGYLRAGKVLTKMDKPHVALEIYGHGLKCIKHVGTGYEALRTTHSELQAKLAPNKSVDPFTILPRELAITILEHLDFPTRMTISRACRGWDQFIRSVPSLWQHLDLSCRPRKKVRPVFISKAINTARNHITAVSLFRLQNFDKTLAALCKHCPSLQTMTIGDTGWVGTEMVEHLASVTNLKELHLLPSVIMNMQYAKRIVDNCAENIEILEIGSLEQKVVPLREMPRLGSLRYTVSETNTLSWQQVLNPVLSASLSSLFVQDSKLCYRLDLLDLRTCTNLRDFELHSGNEIAWCGVILPPSLQRLCLTCGRDRNAGSTQERVTWLHDQYLPELQTIELDLNLFDTADLFALLDPVVSTDPNVSTELQGGRLSDISNLALQSRNWHGKHWLELNHPRLLNLKVLSMSQSPDLGDDTLRGVCQQYSKLESVDISMTGVSGLGLKDAVLTRQLKRVVVNGCNINRDAIDRARAQGVIVVNASTYANSVK